MDKTFKRSTRKQVILALLTNFSILGPSTAFGFSAVAIPVLKNTLNESQISWFASIAALAMPFGSFFSGAISDRFGRRSAIFCINITCLIGTSLNDVLIGWLVIYTAYYSDNKQYVLLLLGRLITGLSAGLASSPAATYMAEISSLAYRGVFTTWPPIYFSSGILLVYILGFLLKDSWHLIALITCCFPCLGLIFVAFFIPESPSWLVGKNRLDEAKTNVCLIFGAQDYNSQVQTEIDTLIKAKGIKIDIQKKPIHQQMLRKIKYLFKPRHFKPFCLALALFFFQQFSGVFAVVFYAVDIVKSAGVSIDPYLGIVLIGVIRVGTAILVSCISKKVGKRPLALVSGTGIVLCMLCLGSYCLLVSNGKISGTTTSWLPLMLILLYFFTSTLGFLPVPFALAAEMFPTKIRGTASGLLTGFGSACNFITVKIYPNMINGIGITGIFFFYGSVALIGTIFMMFLLPETRGKSLDEILAHFERMKEGEEDLEDFEKKDIYRRFRIFEMYTDVVKF